MSPKFWSRMGWLFTPSRLRTAYRATFRNPDAHDYVLPDLAEFCHATEPAPPTNELFSQGRFAGRRDVWLHIREYLDLNDEQLAALLRQRSVLSQQEAFQPEQR